MAADTTNEALSRLSEETRTDLKNFLKCSTRRLNAAETMEALSASILFKWREESHRLS